MSEFVYLYRSTDAASRAAMGSPEQMQKVASDWMALPSAASFDEPA